MSAQYHIYTEPESGIPFLRTPFACDCGAAVFTKIDGRRGRAGDQAYACGGCGRAYGSWLCDAVEVRPNRSDRRL